MSQAVTLNQPQQQAVRYIHGPLLVLAGAGSGKTRMLTAKIGYLINQCGLAAEHITAVTFTNKAAKEMKQRAKSFLPGQNHKTLTITTFHNLGLNIIRSGHKLLQLKASFSIFDDQDSKSLIQDLMQKDRLDQDASVDFFSQQISQWKNNLWSPQQAEFQCQHAKELLAAKVYAQYQRHLRAYHAVDFDDLIFLPCQLFSQYSKLLEQWQHKIRYLLIDEYQDTNDAQYDLMKLLMRLSGKFTVVGDEDQSIYAWRGAQPENLMRLKQDFKSLKVIILEQNYRCTQPILQVANALIAHNPRLFSKKLWSKHHSIELPKIKSFATEEDEVEWITQFIFQQTRYHRRALKDFAILYRSNFQARLFELKLRALQIPYTVSGGTSFFARTEIKDVIAYLRLLTNPDDDNAFLRIINTPKRHIGPSTLEKLSHYANLRQCGLLQACQEFGLNQTLSGQSLKQLQEFSHWLQQTTKRCYQETTIKNLQQILRDIDYYEWIKKQCKHSHTAQAKMQNVEFLFKTIATMLVDLEQLPAHKNALDLIVNQLILRDIISQQDSSKKPDEVQLMTLHAAKGLEFPVVLISGLIEDVLPHKTSIEQSNIEEERRLLYVGITRSQQQLFLTYANKRKQHRKVINCVPSRFLAELSLPQNHAADQNIKTRHEQETIAKNHLQAMRKQLS